MLVYGDVGQQRSSAGMCASIEATLRRALQAQALQRHALTVAAFIEASELVQAAADAEFSVRGCDAVSPAQDAGLAVLRKLATAIATSWRSGFADVQIDGVAIAHWLQRIGTHDALGPKRAEGYTHYALYPELYLEAAYGSGLGPGTIVIGIRSIGAGLAALVAAAIGANHVLTLRPVGHPFARRIEAAPDLTAWIAARGNAHFAVVDEGPGLSGSSLFAVADWLIEAGVIENRIHFFPSHAGEPGSEASAANRLRWQRSRRHTVDFDETFVASERLGGWVADVVGSLDAPLLDISGGEWRSLTAGKSPADSRMERRKFLAQSAGRRWLVKFAGLGADSERKLRTARRLAEAGFCVQPAGLCHGFLVEPWIEGCGEPDRRALLARIGEYLAWRAANLPAFQGGASLNQLADMAFYNSDEALGAAAALSLRALLGEPERLAPLVHRVETDNRLHSWEWLAAGNGPILKSDALDHSSAHDMIGCQDIAWDAAGAIVEHELDTAETDILLRRVEQAGGRAIDPGLLAFLTPCYIAFQLGLWTLAANANGPNETSRLRGEADRYASRLAAMLA